MNLLAALTIAALFATGIRLILRRNLIEVAVGTIMLSNASFVFIVAASFGGFDPPVLPVPRHAIPGDPLAQALALTAMVISFGISAFLLALVYRFHRHHHSLDQAERPRPEDKDSRQQSSHPKRHEPRRKL